jgi:hypothetical protein
MRYRKRTYYTEEQKALMWDRWQYPPADTPTLCTIIDTCRTRRDIARHSGWAITALYCVAA